MKLNLFILFLIFAVFVSSSFLTVGEEKKGDPIITFVSYLIVNFASIVLPIVLIIKIWGDEKEKKYALSKILGYIFFLGVIFFSFFVLLFPKIKESWKNVF